MNTHDLSDEELAQWKRFYEQGVNYEFDGSFEQVLAAYEAAAEIDPHHAELQFRRGLVYGKLNAFAQARTYITLARDLDALPVRPDTRLNEIIQEAAEGQADTIFLVDAMESFSNDSFAGLPGRTLFYDHVHLTLEGNYRLALLFAERISEFLPEAMKEDAMRSWIGAPLVHRQLAATDWDQHRVWSQVMKRLATAPFALRMDGSAEVAHAESQAQAFKTKHALSLGKQIYEEALRDRPSDFLLRSRYADFLTRHALQEEAEVQQEWIRVNFPDAP